MAKKLQKFVGKQVKAYELGAGSTMEVQLIAEGKIAFKNGIFYLRSTEVVNAGSENGQRAVPGDFFKVDGEGNPYPNERKWFLENHIAVDAVNNLYEQKPKPLEAWFYGDPETDALQFALEKGLIHLDYDDTKNFFGAQLWGEWLTAPKDAAIIFYSVTRENGVVTAIDFNFVIREEIEKNYRVIEE
ncbi:MAG: hypothetical protein IJH39_10965 [Clostridia bacterium]|nr:hypothetical protein [Clostridia bacterium]